MYKILSARDTVKLVEVVSEHLSSGWQVTGGISHKDGIVYQAVYKLNVTENLSLWASFKKWFFRNLYKRES